MDETPEPKLDSIGTENPYALTFDAVEILKADFENYKIIVLSDVDAVPSIRDVPTEAMVELRLSIIYELARGSSDDRVIAARKAKELHNILSNILTAYSVRLLTEQLRGSQRRKRVYVLAALVIVGIAMVGATHSGFVKAEWAALVNWVQSRH